MSLTPLPASAPARPARRRALGAALLPAALLPLLLVAAGCSLGGAHVPPVREFELPSPRPDALEVAAGMTVDRLLLFAEISAPLRLDERLVIVDAESGARHLLEGVRWADRPERLMSERLRHRLRAAGTFRGIVRRPVGERYLELRCLLLAFEVRRAAGNTVARLALDAYLVDTRDGRLVWNGLLAGEETPASLEPADIVAALGRAFDTVSGQLVAELARAVPAADAGAAAPGAPATPEAGAAKVD